MRHFPELTQRQEEVLTLLTAGLSDQQIASHLTISLYTAKNHLKAIYARLAVNDRCEAIGFYFRRIY